MLMLRGMAATLEQHHGVRILEEAVAAAVRLSHRYLTGRQLPDKAVSVLDTACARISLGQNSMPAPIEDTTRELADLSVLSHALQRESSAGANHSERLAEVAPNQSGELRLCLERQEVCVRRLRPLAVLELVAQLLVDEDRADRHLRVRALASRVREHGARQAFIEKRLHFHGVP
jgi:type VI secretion system protein VasG